MSAENLKEKIKKSWDSFICYPKGSKYNHLKVGEKDFFVTMRENRYLSFPHILKVLNMFDFKGKKVLEIGCGIGNDLLEIAKKGGVVTGIDLSPKSLALAKKNFRLFKYKGFFKVNDAENLAFKPKSFDVVYSMGVLHHTPDTAKTIKELYRVLKPKGQAIVMLYHKNFFTYWIKLFLIRGILEGQLLEKSFEEIRNNLEYDGCCLAKLFSRKETIKMFSDAGFKQIKTEVFYIYKESFPLIGRILPQSFLDVFAKRFGFHLLIYAQK